VTTGPLFLPPDFLESAWSGSLDILDMVWWSSCVV
jgi:hypothetical protein